MYRVRLTTRIMKRVDICCLTGFCCVYSVNIFLIAVLRKSLPERALLYYWIGAVSFALVFSISGASIKDLFGYDPEYVCACLYLFSSLGMKLIQY
jgi:hypothetical protein